jgi:hypothetical protein
VLFSADGKLNKISGTYYDMVSLLSK